MNTQFVHCISYRTVSNTSELEQLKLNKIINGNNIEVGQAE